MKRWRVITRAEVRRTYEVEAEDAKAALAATTFVVEIDEEEIEEESLVIEEIISDSSAAETEVRCTCAHDTTNGVAHADECPVDRATQGIRTVANREGNATPPPGDVLCARN